MFLRLTGFLLALYISLEHGLHEGHALITPRLLGVVQAWVGQKRLKSNILRRFFDRVN